MHKARELAQRLGVDGWYTCDQTHYLQIARHRTRIKSLDQPPSFTNYNKAKLTRARALPINCSFILCRPPPACETQ